MDTVRLFELTKKAVLCFDNHTLVVKRFGIDEFFTIPIKDLRLVELKRVVRSKRRMYTGGMILTAAIFGAVLLADPLLRLSMIPIAGACLLMMWINWQGDMQMILRYKKAGHHRERPETFLLPRFRPKDWAILNEIAQLVNSHLRPHTTEE